MADLVVTVPDTTRALPAAVGVSPTQVASVKPSGGDDTAAIQAALNAAGSGGVVALHGTYTLSAALTAPAGVRVVGSNRATLTLPTSGAFAAFLIDGTAGVQIRGLRVVAAGATADGACAVTIRGNATDVTIEDVRAEGLYDGFRVDGGLGGTPGTAKRVQFVRCHASSSTTYGFRIDDVDGLEIAHCTSVVSGLDGVKLRKLARNVVLTGGHFTGATGGDGLDAYAGGSTFTINGGVYSGNTINGLTIKTDDLNKTDSATYGHVRNISVIGVHADGNSGNGLALHRNAETDDTTEPLVARVTVQGGTFNGNAGRGIFLRARQVSLVGIIAARNGLEGIDVMAGALDVSIIGAQIGGNSTTTTNTRDGIRVAGTRTQIIGGSIVGSDPDGAVDDAALAAGTKTQRYGIRVEAGAVDTLVSGVALKHNATLPFSDASGTAIVMPGFSDDATWPQISLPNNKRLYTRTSSGGFSSALYMTTGNALNVGDSTNVATLSFLASGTVDVFPQLRALNASGIKLGSLTTDPTITKGTGTPEGAVTAPVGSIRLRTDGGAGTTFYVKESGSGNTGWIAK